MTSPADKPRQDLIEQLRRASKQSEWEVNTPGLYTRLMREAADMLALSSDEQSGPTAIQAVVEACAEELGHDVIFGEIPGYIAELKAQLASAKRDADHFYQLSGKYLDQLNQSATTPRKVVELLQAMAAVNQVDKMEADGKLKKFVLAMIEAAKEALTLLTCSATTPIKSVLGEVCDEFAPDRNSDNCGRCGNTRRSHGR